MKKLLILSVVILFVFGCNNRFYTNYKNAEGHSLRLNNDGTYIYDYKYALFSYHSYGKWNKLSDTEFSLSSKYDIKNFPLIVKEIKSQNRDSTTRLKVNVSGKTEFVEEVRFKLFINGEYYRSFQGQSNNISLNEKVESIRLECKLDGNLFTTVLNSELSTRTYYTSNPLNNTFEIKLEEYVKNCVNFKKS